MGKSDQKIFQVIFSMQQGSSRKLIRAPIHPFWEFTSFIKIHIEMFSYQELANIWQEQNVKSYKFDKKQRL